MIGTMMSRSSLLFILGVLVSLRIVVLPIIEWQGESLALIDAKRIQVNKTVGLIEATESNRFRLEDIEARLGHLGDAVFEDSGAIKLALQQSIRRILSSNKVNMTSFEWSYDDYQGPLRMLRATVLFSGPTEGVITSFGTFNSSPKMIKISQWSQRFVQPELGALGSSRGSMVVELYTMRPNHSVSDLDSALVGDDNE